MKTDNNIAIDKLLTLLAAGSLTFSACAGRQPSQVSSPAHRSIQASSAHRPLPEPAITAWSYVNLYYQTVPPAGAVYVRTWARESLAYSEYMVFDEWMVPQGSLIPVPTVSPAAQIQPAAISAPPQPCPVMLETVQTNSNAANVTITRCY